MRPTLGTSTSTTATSTPTTRPTTTRFGWCEAERDHRCGGGGEHPPPPFGLRALTQAFDACRRGKRTAADTQAYSARLLDHLLATRNALDDGSWRPLPGQVFVCTRPKLREIHAAPFADRVVHHALVKQWEALYERSFIHDSYANRVGKGSHAAVDRLQRMQRKAVAQCSAGQGPYALQLDVANFFHSIDRRLLWRLLLGRLRRAVGSHRLSRDTAQALWRPTREILRDEPAQRAQRLGSAARLDAVPAHKRLGARGPGIGLPIGNLASQFFGNVLLDRLDQFVKHRLKVRWYVRYVDDFVLLAAAPEQLVAWREQIQRFLAEELHLTLRDSGRLAPVRNGVDFLGFIVRPGYRLVRRRTLRHCWSQLAAFERKAALAAGFAVPSPPGRRWRAAPDEGLFEAKPSAPHVPSPPAPLPMGEGSKAAPNPGFAAPSPPANSWKIGAAALDGLRACLASYLAQFRHANVGRLWARLLSRFGWLGDLFIEPEQALADGLQPRWRLPLDRAARSLRQQLRGFAARCPGHVLLVQVGHRWRVFEPGCLQAGAGEPPSRALALTISEARRCVRRWRDEGRAYAVLRQDGFQKDGRRRRVMVAMWCLQPMPIQEREACQ